MRIDCIFCSIWVLFVVYNEYYNLFYLIEYLGEIISNVRGIC